MASSVIHIAVASEINKWLKRDNNKFLIGSIAPDISKLIGETKKFSHFLDNDDDIPNLNRFKKKYQKYFYDDFVLGYFVHLYTDYLWFKYFITDIKYKNCIKNLNDEIIDCDENQFIKYIYNDYTNLNIILIDKYNLSLKIFYEEIPKLENIIEEIPMKKISLIIDKAGVIIKNTKVGKSLLFDIKNISQFISFSVNIILTEITNGFDFK